MLLQSLDGERARLRDAGLEGGLLAERDGLAGLTGDLLVLDVDGRDDVWRFLVLLDCFGLGKSQGIS